jgi:deoxycytidine triphosphate deaminase
VLRRKKPAASQLTGKDCSPLASQESPAAAERAKKWEYEDPFLQVQPALLSAIDVWNYIRVTAMVHPYSDDDLKAASYQVRMGGQFIRWENGKKLEQTVDTAGAIILPPNSISFVQTEAIFRLPHYIAMRFNLQISHVHRGILLGTGPVVDPGFQGRLLIPLHNLTSAAYRIPANEPLIWVEFTKTTFGRRQADVDHLDTTWRNYLFPPDKRHLSPDQYFRRANNLDPIESSIPEAIALSKADATEAAEAAKNARADALAAKTAAERSERQSAAADKKLLGIGVASFFAAVAAVIAIYLQAVGIVQDAATTVTDAREVVEQAKAAEQADRAAAVRVRRLEKRIKELESNLTVPARPVTAATPPPSATPR